MSEGMNALILYWSATGNTRQVAKAIEAALDAADIRSRIEKIAPDLDLELYDYDLVFLGCPSYQFQPPKPVLDYCKARMALHGKRGDIELAAPPKPGKHAVVFCTYSGPHTGIREAIPVGKYLGQFFEHLGFAVHDEWYVVGEFRNRSEELNLEGRLGDIRGHPNEQDLAQIRHNTQLLLQTLQQEQG